MKRVFRTCIPFLKRDQFSIRHHKQDEEELEEERFHEQQKEQVKGKWYYRFIMTNVQEEADHFKFHVKLRSTTSTERLNIEEENDNQSMENHHASFKLANTDSLFNQHLTNNIIANYEQQHVNLPQQQLVKKKLFNENPLPEDEELVHPLVIEEVYTKLPSTQFSNNTLDTASITLSKIDSCFSPKENDSLFKSNDDFMANSTFGEEKSMENLTNLVNQPTFNQKNEFNTFNPYLDLPTPIENNSLGIDKEVVIPQNNGSTEKNQFYNPYEDLIENQKNFTKNPIMNNTLTSPSKEGNESMGSNDLSTKPVNEKNNVTQSTVNDEVLPVPTAAVEQPVVNNIVNNIAQPIQPSYTLQLPPQIQNNNNNLSINETNLSTNINTTVPKPPSEKEIVQIPPPYPVLVISSPIERIEKVHSFPQNVFKLTPPSIFTPPPSTTNNSTVTNNINVNNNTISSKCNEPTTKKDLELTIPSKDEKESVGKSSLKEDIISKPNISNLSPPINITQPVSYNTLLQLPSQIQNNNFSKNISINETNLSPTNINLTVPKPPSEKEIIQIPPPYPVLVVSSPIESIEKVHSFPQNVFKLTPPSIFTPPPSATNNATTNINVNNCSQPGTDTKKELELIIPTEDHYCINVEKKPFQEDNTISRTSIGNISPSNSLIIPPPPKLGYSTEINIPIPPPPTNNMVVIQPSMPLLPPPPTSILNISPYPTFNGMITKPSQIELPEINVNIPPPPNNIYNINNTSVNIPSTNGLNVTNNTNIVPSPINLDSPPINIPSPPEKIVDISPSSFFNPSQIKKPNNELDIRISPTISNNNEAPSVPVTINTPLQSAPVNIENITIFNNKEDNPPIFNTIYNTFTNYFESDNQPSVVQFNNENVKLPPIETESPNIPIPPNVNQIVNIPSPTFATLGIPIKLIGDTINPDITNHLIPSKPNDIGNVTNIFNYTTPTPPTIENSLLNIPPPPTKLLNVSPYPPFNSGVTSFPSLQLDNVDSSQINNAPLINIPPPPNIIYNITNVYNNYFNIQPQYENNSPAILNVVHDTNPIASEENEIIAPKSKSNNEKDIPFYILQNNIVNVNNSLVINNISLSEDNKLPLKLNLNKSMKTDLILPNIAVDDKQSIKFDIRSILEHSKKHPVLSLSKKERELETPKLTLDFLKEKRNYERDGINKFTRRISATKERPIPNTKDFTNTDNISRKYQIGGFYWLYYLYLLLILILLEILHWRSKILDK